jgi:hypothetical protein
VAAVLRANPNPPQARGTTGATGGPANKGIKVAPSFGARNRNSNQDTIDLVSDALPVGRLWHEEPNAVSNALFRIYDDSRNVIIPKTRRRVPKHGTRYGVLFTPISPQQLHDEQLTAEADFMARGVHRPLVSTKQIL